MGVCFISVTDLCEFLYFQIVLSAGHSVRNKFMFLDHTAQLVCPDYSQANTGLSELGYSLGLLVLGIDCCMGST